MRGCIDESLGDEGRPRGSEAVHSPAETASDVAGGSQSFTIAGECPKVLLLRARGSIPPRPKEAVVQCGPAQRCTHPCVGCSDRRRGSDVPCLLAVLLQEIGRASG